MQIVSWNPTAHRATPQALLALLQTHEPEALCLHDSDVLADEFPLHELYDLGYYVKIHGSVDGTGVALLSPEPPRTVRRDASAVLSGELAAIRIVVGSGDLAALVEHVEARVAPHEQLLVVDPRLDCDRAADLRLLQLAPSMPFFTREPLAGRLTEVSYVAEHPQVRFTGIRPLEIPDRDMTR